MSGMEPYRTKSKLMFKEGTRRVVKVVLGSLVTEDNSTRDALTEDYTRNVTHEQHTDRLLTPS